MASRETWIAKQCETPQENDGLRFYTLMTKVKFQNSPDKIQVFTIGQKNAFPIKSVLLLGETGAGKTHLINGFINHIFGVNFNEPFRLKLKDQIVDETRDETESQTDYITAYIVYHHNEMPYTSTNFMFIDTPGYCDTRGKAYQEEISNRLNTLFMDEFEMDDLNCIAIVAKANENRHMEHTKSVLDGINSLFGKACENITSLVCTFATDDTPVVKIVEKNGIQFTKCYKFDNFPLFHHQEKLTYRWNEMKIEYCKFFEDLCASLAVSVRKIRELCNKKKAFGDLKVNLSHSISGMGKLIEYLVKRRKAEKMLRKEAENVKYKEIIHKETKAKTKAKKGFHAHSCPKCKLTCQICGNPPNDETPQKAAEKGIASEEAAAVGAALVTGTGAALITGAAAGAGAALMSAAATATASSASASLASVASGMMSVAIAGAETGIVGGPVGIAVGTGVGAMVGIAAGIGIMYKLNKIIVDCPLAKSEVNCNNKSCGHKLSEHEISDEEFIITTTVDERVDEEQLKRRKVLMTKANQIADDIGKKESELRIEKMKAKTIIVNLTAISKDISELSSGLEIFHVKEVIQEIQENSSDPYNFEAVRWLWNIFRELVSH